MSHRLVPAFALSVALASLPQVAWGAQGVETVDAAWKKAMLANDVEAIVKNYARDAVLWLPDMSEARGEAAIRSAYSGLLGANTVKDVKITDTRYRTSGKTSVGWGRYAITLEPKGGGKATTLAGRFSEVAEKRDGRWVYIVDHASAEPPPSPTVGGATK